MKIDKIDWQKNIKCSIIPGILIGLMISLGNVIKYEHGFVFSWIRLLSCIGIMALSVTIISLIFAWWDMAGAKAVKVDEREYLPNRMIKKSFVYFAVMSIVLLVIWLPALLALYPGVYAYDASWQYDMYMQGQVTAHHPVFHTYLVGWLIDTFYSATGAFNKGILANTLAQELIMALGCGFVFYEFHRRKAPTWIHVLALVFFGVHPTFVLFVFSSTKDSLFAIALADLVLLSLAMFKDAGEFFGKKSNIILWILFSFEVLTLRNNSVYAAIVAFPFLLAFFCRLKLTRSKAFLMLLGTIALFLIYQYPVSNAITVGGVSRGEMLSVPSQQIFRVYNYHTDELSEEDKARIGEFYDKSNMDYFYQPLIADMSKGCLKDEALEDGFGDYLKLWVDLGVRYPGEYVDSFLENTYGFWYPWPQYIIYALGGEGYTPVTVRGPGEENPKIPALNAMFKEFETGSIVMGYDWISWLFAPATYLYIAIIVVSYLLKAKKKNLAIPFVYLGALWLTYLLGPVAMVRYALYLFALVPVWPMYIRNQNTVSEGQ